MQKNWNHYLITLYKHLLLYPSNAKSRRASVKWSMDAHPDGDKIQYNVDNRTYDLLESIIRWHYLWKWVRLFNFDLDMYDVLDFSSCSLYMKAINKQRSKTITNYINHIEIIIYVNTNIKSSYFCPKAYPYKYRPCNHPVFVRREDGL